MRIALKYGSVEPHYEVLEESTHYWIVEDANEQVIALPKSLYCQIDWEDVTKSITLKQGADDKILQILHMGVVDHSHVYHPRMIQAQRVADKTGIGSDLIFAFIFERQRK